MELRASGEVGFGGSIGYRAFHGFNREGDLGCGFAGQSSGILGLEWIWRGVGGEGMCTGGGVSGEAALAEFESDDLGPGGLRQI